METRTSLQNRSLHKLFTDIATECVARGIDQKTVINHFEKFETPVTPQSVKEIWRVIQVNMTGKESTTELTTAEVNEVFGVFVKFWGELTGEHFPFPSIEALMDYDDVSFR